MSGVYQFPCTPEPESSINESEQSSIPILSIPHPILHSIPRSIPVPISKIISLTTAPPEPISPSFSQSSSSSLSTLLFAPNQNVYSTGESKLPKEEFTSIKAIRYTIFDLANINRTKIEILDAINSFRKIDIYLIIMVISNAIINGDIFNLNNFEIAIRKSIYSFEFRTSKIFESALLYNDKKYFVKLSFLFFF